MAGPQKKKNRITKDEAVYTIVHFPSENAVTYVHKTWVCVGEKKVNWTSSGGAMSTKLSANPFPGGGGWIQLEIEVLGYARKYYFRPGDLFKVAIL